ncbi:MAG: hypothetical protein EXQ57_10240 [Bryobacterales bacterium]|nr:hypothetical protein [Bryobacterales bacterium]
MTVTRAYDELIDVLTCGATTERLANFRSSPETQARVGELIKRKKVGAVTREEIAEMEEYLTIEHVMIMTKARARQRLQA